MVTINSTGEIMKIYVILNLKKSICLLQNAYKRFVLTVSP